MPPTGLDKAALAIFQPGEETRWRRKTLRAVLRSWPADGYCHSGPLSTRAYIREFGKRQLKKDLRDEGYGIIGITVAFVFLTAAGAALSWVCCRVLDRLFPEHKGGMQDDGFRQQMTEWSKSEQ